MPFSPHLADFQPVDPSQKFGYSLVRVQFWIGGTKWEWTSSEGDIVLYGASQHAGKMLTMHPANGYGSSAQERSSCLSARPHQARHRSRCRLAHHRPLRPACRVPAHEWHRSASDAEIRTEGAVTMPRTRNNKDKQPHRILSIVIDNNSGLDEETGIGQRRSIGGAWINSPTRWGCWRGDHGTVDSTTPFVKSLAPYLVAGT